MVSASDSFTNEPIMYGVWLNTLIEASNHNLIQYSE